MTPFSQAAKTVNVASDVGYWNDNTAELDEQRKKYRSIPVPVTLAENQKFVDEKQRLELMVDYLATKNDFTEAFPHIRTMSLSDQIHEVKLWIDKVKNAPPEQQEDAQRSLGGHLKDFGSMIGKGLLRGASKVFEAPVIGPILDAASRPGEETAGALIYNCQKYFQRGEQTFERNVDQWRKDNADASWFKRGWYSPVAREHGFGVPMGVHLPLEIIFDPLNFVPFGWLNKPVKYGSKALKGIGKGSEARYAKRARHIGKLYHDQGENIVNSVEANEDAIFAAQEATDLTE